VRSQPVSRTNTDHTTGFLPHVGALLCCESGIEPCLSSNTSVSPDLRPGITYRLQYRIPADKTVPDVYPEFAEFQQMPRVFATGFMVALIEQACLLAVKPYLDWPHEQTVGTHVNLSHLAATPPGHVVTVQCEVTEVQGRRIRFRASARDESDLISEGTHERTVIDFERFNQRLEPKKKTNAE
jgi:fluoroacetyl-CoA thioesterase